MKKIIISYLLLCLMLNAGMVYAYTVDDPSIINPLEYGETFVNGEIRTDLENVQYVGNGYLVDKINEDGQKQKCFTEDFINFRNVNVYDDSVNFDSFSRAGKMDDVKWIGGTYMARSNVYDVPAASGRVLEKNGCLYILNTDFELVKKIEFEDYVREMSYIDGVYYIRLTDEAFLYANKWGSTIANVVSVVYSSTDLETWTERTDLQHVPITNGINVITIKDYNIYKFENGEIGRQIVYEDVKLEKGYAYDKGSLQVLNALGEYFHIVNNTTINYSWISKDGIYYTQFKIPAPTLKNGVGTINYYFDEAYIKKSDIDRYLLTGDIYVRYGDKILGFETPPVMENDRTLVPMRFLFEQMGASVDWNPETESATATLSNNAVTFSIDNNDASVNNQIVTMDVPARLINDKTMVPLRFLSENLGYTVTWDEETNTAIIE